MTGKYSTNKTDAWSQRQEYFQLEILANSNSYFAIAHRGRDKTEAYIRKRYSGLSQKVVDLFVRMCSLHQQQKSVTDHQKKPINHAIQTDGFMNHVEIDLMEFQKLAVSLSRKKTHMEWLLHVSDHFTKHSWMIPLGRKHSIQVVTELEKLFTCLDFQKRCIQTTERNSRTKT